MRLCTSFIWLDDVILCGAAREDARANLKELFTCQSLLEKMETAMNVSNFQQAARAVDEVLLYIPKLPRAMHVKIACLCK